MFHSIESTACATPHGERGICIALQQCPSLVNSNRYQLYQCGNTNNPRNPFVMPITYAIDQISSGKNNTVEFSFTRYAVRTPTNRQAINDHHRINNHHLMTNPTIIPSIVHHTIKLLQTDTDHQRRHHLCHMISHRIDLLHPVANLEVANSTAAANLMAVANPTADKIGRPITNTDHHRRPIMIQTISIGPLPANQAMTIIAHPTISRHIDLHLLPVKKSSRTHFQFKIN